MIRFVINKDFLLYNKLYWSLFASRFLTEPRFICPIPCFICRYRCSIFGCAVSARACSPVVCLYLWSILCLHIYGGSVFCVCVPWYTNMIKSLYNSQKIIMIFFNLVLTEWYEYFVKWSIKFELICMCLFNLGYPLLHILPLRISELNW